VEKQYEKKFEAPQPPKNKLGFTIETYKKLTEKTPKKDKTSSSMEKHKKEISKCLGLMT